MYRLLTSLYAILCISCMNTLSVNAQSQVGQWTDHLPWRPAVAVVVKNDVTYCASAQGLFSVANGPDFDIRQFSKINGLHDIGISAMATNSDEILIAYHNSNLDLLSGNNSYNIPDLMRKQVAADKSVFRIVYHNDKAYLCTGLGIVVLNTAVREIEATYVIGSTGDYTPVYGIAFLGNTIYAATSEGVRAAPSNSRNLSDFRSWSSVTEGLSTDTIQEIIVFNNQLICRQRNQLFQLAGNTWTPRYTSNGAILNIHVDNNTLLISERLNAGVRILITDADNNIRGSLFNTPLKAPQQIASGNNDIWVADSISGLLKYNRQNDDGFTTINPDAPEGIITGDMVFFEHKLWAAPGNITADWKPGGNRDGYYWTEFGRFGKWTSTPLPDSLPDIVTLAADPAGKGIYAGSFSGGLYFVGAGRYKTYKQGVIPPAANNPAAYNVSGLTTDATGNLWVAAYGATNNLLVKKADDIWVSFRSPYAMTDNAISQLLVDDAGLVYIVSPKGNGLYVLDHKNTLDNKSDDQWRQYRLGSTLGNLPSNDVYCVAKDRNGSIWVGTARGVAILNCPGTAAGETCNAILPVIQQDNFAGYLFQDEQVTSIAVDGANRKWVGTLHGAWLVSEDGEKILLHFDADNSPLPDDHIYRIAIDPATGEVYFATGKGLMSWHGTATEPATEMKRDSVLVFPNPVAHNYTGNIAIRGLVENTRVKITDISGRMVFQTRAFGGQAIWNGLDYTGHRPQTGVYLVFAASETGGEHIVTKIVFVN